MLAELTISNYALIDSLELRPAPGLSIITGETGAGKSIILGALSLLLGGRADAKGLRRADAKAVVEGRFTALFPDMAALFEAEGADWNDTELILRREVLPSGRTRAFVNDTPVSLRFMASVGNMLVDIHSQRQNAELLDSRWQLELVDAVADNTDERAAYRAAYRAYVDAAKRLKTLKEEASRQRADEEFTRFRLEQLEKLHPQAGEMATLERRVEILGSAETLREHLEEAVGRLTADERGILPLLYEVRSHIGDVNTSIFEAADEAGSMQARLESVYLELNDIAETLSQWQGDTVSDSRELERSQTRLGQLEEALRRFKVDSDAELVALYESLKREQEGGGNKAEIAELEEQVRHLGASLRKAAEALSESRKEAANVLADKIVETARPLGLPNLRVSFVVSKARMGASGGDAVEMLCAFNKNQRLLPADKGASGGEMARLMLSVKAILAGRVGMPTLVLDEVDSGVSGEIAHRMGAMMRGMAATMQVIVITHLPQVAAKGEMHFKVSKRDTEDKTITSVAELTPAERERELAAMMSGSEIGEAALLNARQLLSDAETPGSSANTKS